MEDEMLMGQNQPAMDGMQGEMPQGIDDGQMMMGQEPQSSESGVSDIDSMRQELIDNKDLLGLSEDEIMAMSDEEVQQAYQQLQEILSQQGEQQGDNPFAEELGGMQPPIDTESPSSMPQEEAMPMENSAPMDAVMNMPPQEQQFAYGGITMSVPDYMDMISRNPYRIETPEEFLAKKRYEENKLFNEYENSRSANAERNTMLGLQLGVQAMGSLGNALAGRGKGSGGSQGDAAGGGGKMATGGNVGYNPSVPVEVEGGETAQTPAGTLMDFIGNDHEQGGIPTNLPEGTGVYSKRIGVDGDTFADRKALREKRIATALKNYERNPTAIAKKTYERVRQLAEQEEAMDMQLQMEAQANAEQFARKFATGGFVRKKKIVTAPFGTIDSETPGVTYNRRPISESIPGIPPEDDYLQTQGSIPNRPGDGRYGRMPSFPTFGNPPRYSGNQQQGGSYGRRKTVTPTPTPPPPKPWEPPYSINPSIERKSFVDDMAEQFVRDSRSKYVDRGMYDPNAFRGLSYRAAYLNDDELRYLSERINQRFLSLNPNNPSIQKIQQNPRVWMDRIRGDKDYNDHRLSLVNGQFGGSNNVDTMGRYNAARFNSIDNKLYEHNAGEAGAGFSIYADPRTNNTVEQLNEMNRINAEEAAKRSANRFDVGGTVEDEEEKKKREEQRKRRMQTAGSILNEIGNHMGDILDTYGTFRDISEARKIAAEAAAKRTPYRNFYENYGANVNQQYERAKELATQQYADQQAKIAAKARADRTAARDNAQGVNTQRAMSIAIDQAANDAQSDMTAKYNQQMQDLNLQQAKVMAEIEAKRIEGRDQADIRNRQYIEYNLENRNKILARETKAMQRLAKIFNINASTRYNQNQVNNLSAYGLGFDTNGKLSVTDRDKFYQRSQELGIMPNDNLAKEQEAQQTAKDVANNVTLNAGTQQVPAATSQVEGTQATGQPAQTVVQPAQNAEQAAQQTAKQVAQQAMQPKPQSNAPYRPKMNVAKPASDGSSLDNDEDFQGLKELIPNLSEEEYIKSMPTNGASGQQATQATQPSAKPEGAKPTEVNQAASPEELQMNPPKVETTPLPQRETITIPLPKGIDSSARMTIELPMNVDYRWKGSAADRSGLDEAYQEALKRGKEDYDRWGYLLPKKSYEEHLMDKTTPLFPEAVPGPDYIQEAISRTSPPKKDNGPMVQLPNIDTIASQPSVDTAAMQPSIDTVAANQNRDTVAARTDIDTANLRKGIDTITSGRPSNVDTARGNTDTIQSRQNADSVQSALDSIANRDVADTVQQAQQDVSTTDMEEKPKKVILSSNVESKLWRNTFKDIITQSLNGDFASTILAGASESKKNLSPEEISLYMTDAVDDLRFDTIHSELLKKDIKDIIKFFVKHDNPKTHDEFYQNYIDYMHNFNKKMSFDEFVSLAENWYDEDLMDNEYKYQNFFHYDMEFPTTSLGLMDMYVSYKDTIDNNESLDKFVERIQDEYGDIDIRLLNKLHGEAIEKYIKPDRMLVNKNPKDVREYAAEYLKYVGANGNVDPNDFIMRAKCNGWDVDMAERMQGKLERIGKQSKTDIEFFMENKLPFFNKGEMLDLYKKYVNTPGSDGDFETFLDKISPYFHDEAGVDRYKQEFMRFNGQVVNPYAKYTQGYLNRMFNGSTYGTLKTRATDYYNMLRISSGTDMSFEDFCKTHSGMLSNGEDDFNEQMLSIYKDLQNKEDKKKIDELITKVPTTIIDVYNIVTGFLGDSVRRKGFISTGDIERLRFFFTDRVVSLNKNIDYRVLLDKLSNACKIYNEELNRTNK